MSEGSHKSDSDLEEVEKWEEEGEDDAEKDGERFASPADGSGSERRDEWTCSCGVRNWLSRGACRGCGMAPKQVHGQTKLVREQADKWADEAEARREAERLRGG